jgi:hypothetical protein
MTFISGENTVITINATDISAFTNSTDFTDTTEVYDSTCYGSTRKTKKAGIGDGTITISGVHDDAAGGPRTVLKALKAARAAVTFVFRPEGTGSGLAQSSVSVIVSSYKDSDPVAGLITWEAQLDMTGALTETDQ